MGKCNIGANLAVIARIMDGTKVCGYIVVDRRGNKRPIKKEVFEQMALNGDIVNCSGQIYKNHVNLRGIGKKLTELPAYNRKAIRIK